MPKTAKLTCPHCKGEQNVLVPENGTCLAMHKCHVCGKIVRPKVHCCVVCEFSNTKCPLAEQK